MPYTLTRFLEITVSSDNSIEYTISYVQALTMADTSLTQIGQVFIIFVAINLSVLLLRTVIFVFRTFALVSKDVKQEAQSGMKRFDYVVKRLMAERVVR